MVRWSLIGIGTTIAVVVVIFILWNRSSRDLPSTQQHAEPTDVESSAPAPAKSMPKKPMPPSAQVDPAPKGPSCDQVSESERIPVKPPVAQGPLKVLKGVYQDESRDANSARVERLIRAQFEPKTFPVERLHTVNCRKSVCKIGVFWSDEQPMVLAGVVMKVHRILTSQIAFEPVTEPGDKGDVLVDMYILREGLELKDFE